MSHFRSDIQQVERAIRSWMIQKLIINRPLYFFCTLQVMRQCFTEFTSVVKTSFMTAKLMTNMHQAVIHSGPIQGPMTTSGNVSTVLSMVSGKMTKTSKLQL